MRVAKRTPLVLETPGTENITANPTAWTARHHSPLLDVAEGAEALDGFGVELCGPGTAQQLA